MRAADHEQNTFRFADRRNNTMNIPVSLLHHSGDLPKMEQNHSFISDAGSFASLTQ
jgi:hypothetical protein